MKSILVPTEQHAVLPSILQSALLLARKFDSYMEGFALFPAMVELYALDSGVPLPIEEVRDHDAEMAKQARRAFETFMQGHGVARAERNSALSFGWLDAAPDGDPFVGSYGRVFDAIVLGRPARARHRSSLHRQHDDLGSLLEQRHCQRRRPRLFGAAIPCDQDLFADALGRGGRRDQDSGQALRRSARAPFRPAPSARRHDLLA